MSEHKPQKKVEEIASPAGKAKPGGRKVGKGDSMRGRWRRCRAVSRRTRASREAETVWAFGNRCQGHSQ